MSLLSTVKEMVARLFGKPTAPVVDRRQHPRRLYMRQGFLTILDRPAHPPLECIIRDLSPGGAQLEIMAVVDENSLFGPVRLFIRSLLLGVKFEGSGLTPQRDFTRRR